MESNRIKLALPSLELASPMLEAIEESKQELSEFLPWDPYAVTKEDAVKIMQESTENHRRFENDLKYLIIETETGRLIGSIGLIIRDKSVPFFEVGFWLRTSAVGKGYITEAVSLIENYAFNQLNAKRLEIKAAETNYASRAVADRCGFRHEATLVNARRLASGELGNTVIYCKLGL